MLALQFTTYLQPSKKLYACSNESGLNNKCHVKGKFKAQVINQKLWANIPWLQGTYFLMPNYFLFHQRWQQT